MLTDEGVIFKRYHENITQPLRVFQIHEVPIVDNIETSTSMGSKLIADQKRGIVSEVVKQKLVPDEVLRNSTTVYLGSHTDIEYPLTLGSRDIEMVDYTLKEPTFQEEVKNRIKALINKDPEIQGDQINFEFDFGQGPEPVIVKLKPEWYGQLPKQAASDLAAYTPPEKIGAILSYAGQGPAGRIEVGDDLKSKLVTDGGILIDNTFSRLDRETKQETKIELGTKE
jgi:hypothetical protein